MRQAFHPVLYPRLLTSGDCLHIVLRILSFLWFGLIGETSIHQRMWERRKRQVFLDLKFRDTGSSTCFLPLPSSLGVAMASALLLLVLRHPLLLSLSLLHLCQGALLHGTPPSVATPLNVLSVSCRTLMLCLFFFAYS